MGSASELEYHLLLACDLSYIVRERYAAVSDSITEVKKMLSSFIVRLRAESSSA